MSDRPRRVNGLQPPYTVSQLSTWVFLPALVLEFLFFVSPVLPLAPSIVCTCIFCSIAGASTFYGYMAMKIDPSDPRLLGQHSDNANANDDHETKQCWICDVQVGTKSMHCKFCNKCVDQFDHHCMWLNTCIGKANYLYFFRTMICIALLLTVHSCVQLALILDIYLGNGNSRQRSEEWFNVNSPTATIIVVALMGFFLVFDIGALTLIGQLVMFHLRLQKQGLTTYAFIVQDNRRRRTEAEQQEQLKRRRNAAIAKAEQDGNWWLETKLRHGAFFREACGLACCDPLSQSTPTTDDDDGGGDVEGHNGHNTNGTKNEQSATPASNKHSMNEQSESRATTATSEI